MPRKGKKNRPGLELQDRDIEIFLGLFESRLMTLEHLTRLYFNNRSEAAKKRVQLLKSGHYLGERGRNLYEPSILYLAERAFTALLERSALQEYPSLPWNQLKKRAYVSDLTLRHECSVLDVKTSLSCAVKILPHYELVEFSTWPRLYQFEAAQPPRPGTSGTTNVLIKPDGFVRIYEHTSAEDTFEHVLFLEVDRSTEPRETLALRAYGYQDYYRRGGLAARYGASAGDYEDFPFRVLFVLPNEERRNNMAERLLQNNPPVRTMVWLTTFQEITADPLGVIWMRPLDYRKITRGTEFDPSRERTDVYRRRKEREDFVADQLNKLSLFAVERAKGPSPTRPARASERIEEPKRGAMVAAELKKLRLFEEEGPLMGWQGSSSTLLPISISLCAAHQFLAQPHPVPQPCLAPHSRLCRSLHVKRRCPTSDYMVSVYLRCFPTQENGGLVEKAVISHIEGLNLPKTIITK